MARTTHVHMTRLPTTIEHGRWVYRAWRYRLKLERAEIACLRARLKKGDTVFDVGAHKGAYTYWMRQSVGREGMVYAFEPQNLLADRLSRLVTSNRYGNVIVENLGLSSSEGALMLHLPGSGPSPGASFEEIASTEISTSSVLVNVTTLDTYYRETANCSNPVRLIKCDAEGHELEVFQGGLGLLKSQRPDLLFECEARHRRSGSVDEVFRFLHKLGYRGWYFEQGAKMPVEGFDQAIHQADPGARNYVNNFLFTAGQ